MAHYAKIVDGVVQQVIVADEKFFETFVDSSPGKWLQTSYNTRGGVHYEPNSETPSSDQSKALRKNFAGIDWLYDKTRDIFTPPKPYASWTLDESTGFWKAPTEQPNDGKKYDWDETSKSWKEIT